MLKKKQNSTVCGVCGGRPHGLTVINPHTSLQKWKTKRELANKDENAAATKSDNAGSEIQIVRKWSYGRNS